ncbi:hypothetical protein Trydic_g17125 [Trypoxylus dichotomus]
MMKIPHKSLLLNDKEYRLFRILNTIRLYFKSRRFHTIVNGTRFSKKHMQSGVAQRSALGSVLFTIYHGHFKAPETPSIQLHLCEQIRPDLYRYIWPKFMSF